MPIGRNALKEALRPMVSQTGSSKEKKIQTKLIRNQREVLIYPNWEEEMLMENARYVLVLEIGKVHTK
jgi:hypothetical protein